MENGKWKVESSGSMKKDIIRDKSFSFACRIVKLVQYLREKKREHVLSDQILRSGTSIGALAREAEHAESKADFIHKMSIVLKEANETLYWIDLLKEGNYLVDKEHLSLSDDATELVKLLAKTVKTAKNPTK